MLQKKITNVSSAGMSANKAEDNKNTESSGAVKFENNIFVEKWVDYSCKYGLSYILSDGTVGVYFNDNTKMTTDPKD